MSFVISSVIAISAITEYDVFRILDTNNIKYNIESVQAGMITGMLQAVDKRARLLTTNDVNDLNSLVSIDSSEDLGENIGYLGLNGLYSNGGDEICRELNNTNKYSSGQILDLRNAGGDNLSSVNCIINKFATSNTVLYKVTDNKGSIIESYNVPSNNVCGSHVPLMVLVNSDTCGTSELLAGLLKGKDNVMLIGSKTKGHCGLMEVVPVTESESLYLVTKHVILPSAEQSFTNGITPDIVMVEEEKKKMELPLSGKVMIGKNISEKAIIDRKLMERAANDIVLQRAVDLLLGLKAIKQ
jgi:C-terminal processing protease CtpA/Prc